MTLRHNTGTKDFNHNNNSYITQACYSPRTEVQNAKITEYKPTQLSVIKKIIH